MSRPLKMRIVILNLIVLIVLQIALPISAQQEEKFFYHADFPNSEDDHQVQQSPVSVRPVFPDGPLHVSLGLRALSGDNRPQFKERLNSENGQV